MVKQIAVVLGAINLDNQKKILEGMEIGAREFDCNLFVFTNYVGTRETEESIMAATQVLKLPDFDKFDGVVLVPNTIHNPIALDRIIKELNTLGKPMVSVDRKIDGMSCVSIDSYEAEYEMVEHFLYHGYTNILYVSGSLVASSEARKRCKAFQDAMVNNGIMFDEGDIYEGAFTMESGIMIGEQILAEGKEPEAIICGNDDMAHGIMDVFKRAGYKIPEDVKICGFDNGERSQLDRPSLTTVDKNQKEVGYKAILEIMEILNGKDIEDYKLPCEMKYRESCGCRSQLGDVLSLEDLVEEVKHKYIMQQRDTIFMADVVRGMTADFAKAARPEQLFDVMKQYVPQIGVEKFYLCACDVDQVFALPERNLGRNIDVLDVNDDYTEYIDIAVAYEKGNYTISAILARNAMSELLVKPSFEDLRWRLVYPIHYYETVEKVKGNNNPIILESIIKEESHFNQYAGSSAGAVGLMQLMPATYNEIVKNNNLGSDFYDIENNIRAGSIYYQNLKKSLGNKDLYAISAYNGGIGSVMKWFSKITPPKSFGSCYLGLRKFSTVRYVKFSHAIIKDSRTIVVLSWP